MVPPQGPSSTHIWGFLFYSEKTCCSQAAHRLKPQNLSACIFRQICESLPHFCGRLRKLWNLCVFWQGVSFLYNWFLKCMEVWRVVFYSPSWAPQNEHFPGLVTWHVLVYRTTWNMLLQKFRGHASKLNENSLERDIFVYSENLGKHKLFWT